MKNIFKSLIVTALFFVTACHSSNKKTTPLFTTVPNDKSGIYFSNNIVETPQINIISYEDMYNGSGVAVGDINNDGLPDLFFTATHEDQKLYLNKGHLQFEDITQTAGVSNTVGFRMGCVMVDVNADGWLDIYVCRTGKFPADERRNLLYINNHNNTFTESAKAYGLDDASYSNQSAWLDFDKDGDLDCYIMNRPPEFKFEMNMMYGKDTARQYVSDRLYRNDGNNHFTDVTMKAGVDNYAFGLAVSVCDFNNDTWPDVYVSNDYIKPDYLYINNHDGTFTESMKQYMKHNSNFTMGTDVEDYNNDGLMDMVTLDMVAEDNHRQKILRGPMTYDHFDITVKLGYYYQYMHNMLQLNNGNGSFSEIAYLAGVAQTDWSWCPLMQDFDNDGWKDLYITNGYRRDITNMDYMKYTLDSLQKAEHVTSTDIKNLIDHLPSQKVVNYMFQNNHHLGFTKVNDDWGLTNSSWSNGAVYADLDNDGDLDIVISNIDQMATLLENHSNEMADHNYLQFVLKGDNKNPFGIGATVKLITDSGLQVQQFNPTKGYYSGTENHLQFGLGKLHEAKTVTVIWPNGKQQTLNTVSANQKIILDIKDAVDVTENKTVGQQKIFTDVTAVSQINFVHHENDDFIDFKREPLLPNKFSTEGPCLAAGDVNGDGLQDFFVGAGKGQSSTIYLQTKDGHFSVAQTISRTLPGEDGGACFFDADGDHDLDLYVSSGGYEFDDGAQNYLHHLFINDGHAHFTLSNNLIPNVTTNASCVVAADMDGDGDNDLFVGGGVTPGKYPYNQRSYILKNDGGHFSDVTESVCKELMHPGIVTAAQWADVDGDHKPDLIIAGMWMPVTVFKNNGTSFTIINANSGLENSNGWWNCLSAIDMDGDGDIDFVAGNLGLNTKYKSSITQPCEVFANDFDKNGSTDAVMCYYIQGKSYPTHGRDMLLDQVRELRKKFLRYSEYADATLQDIFTQSKIDSSYHLSAYNMASSFIENLGGGKFKITALPLLAQVSPVYGIACDDFNGDGLQDILLAGNQYETEVETGRYDAGIGLLLTGNGKNIFTPMPVTQSGFYTPLNVHSMLMLNNHFVIVGNNNDALQAMEW